MFAATQEKTTTGQIATREDRERQIGELRQETEECKQQINDSEARERQLQELNEQLTASHVQFQELEERLHWQELHQSLVTKRKEKQIKDLQQQLQVREGEIQKKDAEIAARQQELQLVTQKKDGIIEDRENQLRELRQQLASSEQGRGQLEQNLQQKEEANCELHEDKQQLQQELGQVSQQLMVLQKEKLTLTWKTCKTVSVAMIRGSATVCGSMAYFKSAASSQVHSYNLDAEEWSTLPKCPQDNFSLTVVNGLVTAVGGWQSCSFTNTLLSLKEEGGTKNWVELFPPMPTKRYLTAVVCSGKALVVAGGEGEGYIRLTKVEVMNTDTLQWSTASSLLHPLTNATVTVCGDSVYLMEGQDQNLVQACSLSALLHSVTIGAKVKKYLTFIKENSVWRTIADLPVRCSACVTLNGQLLAVGGKNSCGKATNIIYVHNTETNSWEIASIMPTPRYHCMVTVLPGDKLMVVGGQTATRDTDEVEIATVCRYEKHIPTPRNWCLVTVLPDNKLMVVGGETYTGDTHKADIASEQ